LIGVRFANGLYGVDLALEVPKQGRQDIFLIFKRYKRDKPNIKLTPFWAVVFSE
jgi:hypothetical protein